MGIISLLGRVFWSAGGPTELEEGKLSGHSFHSPGGYHATYGFRDERWAIHESLSSMHEDVMSYAVCKQQRWKHLQELCYVYDVSDRASFDPAHAVAMMRDILEARDAEWAGSSRGNRDPG